MKKRWDVPDHWDLKAQMVFGMLKDGEKRKEWLEDKDVQNVHERLFVYGRE